MDAKACLDGTKSIHYTTILMCYHYIVRQADILSLFDELGIPPTRDLAPRLDLYPLGKGPVLVADPKMNYFEWGLLPSWWKPTTRSKSRKSFQRRCFNARSETVHEKPAFKTSFRQRRCLVPANAFLEKGHYFHLEQDKPLVFAGLRDCWANDCGEVHSYTILTTVSNELVASVEHDRQPVILDTPDKRKQWLNPDVMEKGSLEWLFEPLAASMMTRVCEEDYKTENV